MWIDRAKEALFWVAGVAMLAYICWLALQLVVYFLMRLIGI